MPLKVKSARYRPNIDGRSDQRTFEPSYPAVNIEFHANQKSEKIRQMTFLYTEEGLSIKQISQKLDCSRHFVKDQLRRHGIEMEDYI